MHVDDVIDGFVRVVGSVGVPFVPLNESPWIERLESKLPARLPASFRSLVTRYAYPSFEVGPLALFANDGGGDREEFSNAVFRDKIIAGMTLAAGYIQFARPANGHGWYDPICFDTSAQTKNQEFPIVKLDHEAILTNSRIVVCEVMAKSFAEFAQAIIAMDKDQYSKIISAIERSDF